MIFLYSRKPQLLMLLGWCVGVAAIFASLAGGGPHFTASSVSSGESQARIGDMTAQPDTGPQQVAEPVPVQTIAPDSSLNRGTALRIRPGGDDRKLVLEFDYVAAAKNGFSPDRARDYYIEEPPTVVVSLGVPWEADALHGNFPVNMPQATGVSVIVSQSRHLRLLTHTRTRKQAVEARVRTSPTQTGIMVEIYFPR